MIGRIAILVALPALLMLTTGCQSLFVSNHTATQSPWTNWDQVNIAFNRIVPNHTTVTDLKRMKFDPSVTPNICIMPYVDIVPIFMPNPNITIADLPIGVQVYVESKTNNCAYQVQLEDVREKRHGNLLLDVFGFKRLTHHSGWRFRGLILIKNNVVVYTLSSGEPNISAEDSNLKPLGPFQDLQDSAGHIIGMVH
ncbi:MAG TPA: hypothetical protein VGY56_02725 [Verrucomicrobiae bacterium]|nr:hypothetical protein [Verrucomicrobiae bacterium]